ncbi:hypothetical protein A8709_13830 [Paenibacillus pectinilyticus]|uniref:ABC transporter substrate-binding protein n=1 Tax=Paenibacillus pectinilyticus TaxID=512399 RepID=A0A1C1A3Q6_9BACL|nr:extracellular solute-binding protein [Paenibacillus pectinilyticus]OCT15178.1 hypothetical protein A8709_13830 [Paenibacillus pectinilyticus]
MKETQKKSLLKIVTTASVMTLSASLLAACGNGSDKDAASSPSATASVSASPATNASTAAPTLSSDKHYDITFGSIDVDKALAEADKDAMLQQVQKAVNITLKPQGFSADSVNEKVKLWAASGQLPDLLTYELTNGPTASQWIQQGLVREIPEKLYSKYPNLNKLMNSPEVQATKVNGKFYGLPRLSKFSPDEWALDRGYVVRKDWMDKLGIKTPKTFDEYLAMFKAFAEKDPDGNAKNDTIGLTTNFLDVLTTTIKLGSAVPNLGGWMQEDGKWMYSWASKGMGDYVTKYRKLYAEGALDKDFALLKVGEGGDKFAQGMVGALNIQISEGSLKGLKDKWDKFPHDKPMEDSIAILPGWTAPDNNLYRFYGGSFFNINYVNTSVDDAKLDAILRLNEYNLSEKGKELFNYGIEGTDFKKENNQIVPLQKIAYKSTGAFFYLNGVSLGINGSKDVRKLNIPAKFVDMSSQMYDDLLKNAKPIPINFAVEGINSPLKAKVGTLKWGEALIKVVLGKDDPVKMWQEQIAQFDQKVINDAITEVNDIAAKQGIK